MLKTEVSIGIGTNRANRRVNRVTPLASAVALGDSRIVALSHRLDGVCVLREG